MRKILLSATAALALLATLTAADAQTVKQTPNATVVTPGQKPVVVQPAQPSYPPMTTSGQTTAQAAPVGAPPTVSSDRDTWATRPGPYGRLNTGYSFGVDNVDESWVIGGGVGYRFSPNFRLEGDFDYRPDFGQQTNFGIGPGPKTGLTNWTAMANAFYDFNFAPIRPLVPYIGGGIGIARNEVNDVTVQTSPSALTRLTGSEKNQFAWDAQAGVSYYFTPNMALDVGYRYLDAGSTGLGDLKTHEVTGALRIGF